MVGVEVLVGAGDGEGVGEGEPGTEEGAVAQVVDGITFFDLDTPILMSEDPLAGGYSYDGPLMIPNDEPGLGITPKVFQ